jgi:LmbE family N-acetylglucosaminyl deacetylase
VSGVHGRPTLVAFHAHPDDEVLLTGGVLAAAAARGHRVVLVVATSGGAGLSDGEAGEQLARRRERELRASAAALGCARVVLLGYADSGMDGRAVPSSGRRRFADVEVEAAAADLARLLRQEAAAVLTVYDARGGYGHPDHVQVHRVGVRAAQLAGTPVVLEATVDRDVLRLVLGAARLAGRLVPRLPLLPSSEVYTPRAQITHRVDVRPWLPAKRAAMAAHASQAVGGDGPRTLAVLLRLPGPLLRRVVGTEWYVQRDITPPSRPYPDLFAAVPDG